MIVEKIPRIGRGKNMSIAKAGLIVYFNQVEYPLEYFDYGELNTMHEIVDIAGAKQCSFLTPVQVMGCLRSSSFWDSIFCPKFYSGFRGHGGATLSKPSQKGKEYYDKFLKKDRLKYMEQFVKE